MFQDRDSKIGRHFPLMSRSTDSSEAILPCRYTSIKHLKHGIKARSTTVVYLKPNSITLTSTELASNSPELVRS